jgi:3-dehydroquinate synthase
MTKRSNQPTPSSGGPSNPQTQAPFQVSWTHRLMFTRDALAAENTVLRDAIIGEDLHAGERGLIVVADDGVTRENPRFLDQLKSYFEKHDELPELRDVVHAAGGETCKNDSKLVNSVLESIDRHRICRKSTVLVVGGGAVLDAAGYAASTAHRGVGLIRMPSTVLAQCDSGVGVKNGINRFNKKNFIGTFAPPAAVICDTDLLATLSERDWASGFSEAVKIGMLRDRTLFELMEQETERIVARSDEPALEIIARSAELHLRHITDGGDPFELKEARPLDFGHWAAHKLEQMTDFELRHGEAVSIGVALDTVYSDLMGISEKGLAERTLQLLVALGLPIVDQAMKREDELMSGLEEFREHLGGKLTITMVERLEHQRDVHEIDQSAMRDSISLLLERLEV